MKKYNTVILADNPSFYKGDIIDYVYGSERRQRLGEVSNLLTERLGSNDIHSDNKQLEGVEVIFSTWGMPNLSEDQLDLLPNLKAVFYAAGSVNAFSENLFRRNIRIFSAVEANAIPVAEFCLAQIILSLKGAYRNSMIAKQGSWSLPGMPIGKGIYGETVALLGIGSISKYLIQLLRPLNVKIIAVSNYLASRPEEVIRLGINRLVSIEEAFSEAYVISNHLPDKEDNRQILQKLHFESMREGATFINTGRGAQVNEADLVSTLSEREDITALLDVQSPEPPEKNSPLFSLPNIHMTSHIAGSVNDEVKRMADFMIEDFILWQNGENSQHEVNPQVHTKRA